MICFVLEDLVTDQVEEKVFVGDVSYTEDVDGHWEDQVAGSPHDDITDFIDDGPEPIKFNPVTRNLKQS